MESGCILGDQFKADWSWNPRWAPTSVGLGLHHEKDELDTHAYDHVWCMVWRDRRPARVSKSRRRSEANSV